MRTMTRFALAFATVVAMAFPAVGSVGSEHGRLFDDEDRMNAVVTLVGQTPTFGETLVASARPGDRGFFVRDFDRPFFVRDFVRPRPFFFQPRPFFFQPRPFFFDREEFFDDAFFGREEFFDREDFFEDRDRDD